MNSPDFSASEATIAVPLTLENSRDDTTIRPKKQFLITGLRKLWVELRFRYTIISIAVKSYSNPMHWLYVPIMLDKKRRKAIGQHRLFKLAHVDKRYYWGLYTPGWNAVAFKKFIASEMNHIVPMSQKVNRFINVYVAITKKCSLQCEHCYEWENLNKKEALSAEQLHSIVTKIQDLGTSMIHFSGGEPLLKVDLLVDLMSKAQKDTDFWVLTSGLKLTDENAKRLKSAGLNGVIISLDHFDSEKHNEFRGFKEAYYWVEKGVESAVNNRLVAALSLCATKEFTTLDNLMHYANLAKRIGASFIQILEPRAVGHYAGQDVSLSPEQIKILDDFYLRMNYDSKYKDYPLISYHGYYQRRQGCFASGDRSLYIDTDGDINACPFCQKKTGNVLDNDFDNSLAVLKSRGCHQFTQHQD